MEKLRKPYQGVFNIIRFNWHFYLLSILCVLCLLISRTFLPESIHIILYSLAAIIITGTVFSLVISCYIYDFSTLYQLNWLPDSVEQLKIVNIHAGFDEISNLLQAKYPKAILTVLDFYNPLLHTEVSIKRARRAYAPYPNTQTISTSNLDLSDNEIDLILMVFAAHEIRNDNERIVFFQQIKRVLKPNGKVIVTEHLRDTANFIAYNIGFFHFLSKNTWLNTFQKSGLVVYEEQKVTPFVTTFTLVKHGISS